ncbi:hypothetical protein NUW54_g7153 [Trametes sanguinea]|uniref:Uncharacterized protein n=1 Tax=Trametes sanguinea TaxID=158606 RepID=A0ACC1PPZ8_9APHY|nr:hypothetical protein NUW54_g7153 [Trametes sanguinea]
MGVTARTSVNAAARLRGVKSLQPHILEPLVLAFPNLTHLDLSCTRITPEGLAALGASPTVRLQSLALERCNWLTGESIQRFLVDAPAAQDLRELSLYGDWTFPSPLTEEQLREIVERAPCFKNGQLVYLDLCKRARHARHPPLRLRAAAAPPLARAVDI